MSVDRRLRSGLRADGDVLPAPMEDALDRALRVGRRTRRRRHVFACAASALLIAAVVAAVPSLRGPAPSPAAAGIDGTWRTAPVSPDHLAASVIAAGGDAACAELPAAGPVVWTLRIEGDRFSVLRSVGGAPPIEDRSGFVQRLPGDRIRFVEADDPATSTFLVTLDGDVLHLELDDLEQGGEPGCEVLAEAVVQLAAPFARV